MSNAFSDRETVPPPQSRGETSPEAALMAPSVVDLKFLPFLSRARIGT
jgi:hypothetical protein